MALRRRQRKRSFDDGDGEVPMTPMIDVVFLLLIYFVMTMEPVPIFAHLDVYTPSADRSQQPPRDPPSLIRIGVYADGYTFDGVSVPFAQLEGYLLRLAEASTTQSVLIQCALDSPHGHLVRLLNVCAKHGLRNLSVVSAD